MQSTRMEKTSRNRENHGHSMTKVCKSSIITKNYEDSQGENAAQFYAETNINRVYSAPDLDSQKGEISNQNFMNPHPLHQFPQELSTTEQPQNIRCNLDPPNLSNLSPLVPRLCLALVGKWGNHTCVPLRCQTKLKEHTAHHQRARNPDSSEEQTPNHMLGTNHHWHGSRLT